MTKCRYCGVDVPGDYPLCDSYECGNEDNRNDVADVRRARIVARTGNKWTDITLPQEQIGFVV